MKHRRTVVMFPVNQLGPGGAEQQLLELVRGMDKSRFLPVVVSLYPGGHLEAEVKAVPGAELFCLNRKNKYDFFILGALLRQLRAKRADIIQPFLTPATFFGMLPAMMAGTPVKIVTERCGVRIYRGLGNNLYRKAEDVLTRFADWVIPNSEAGREYLVKRGISPARIKVIYNGINMERLVPDPAKAAQIRQQMGVPPEGKVVGIVASLSPAKNHETFLQAARIIADAMPQVRFSIIGDGPLRSSLEEQTRQLGLDSRVTFHGIQRDVGSYVSLSDVSCLCSKDNEGCSNSTLEAMALGKPVVITDVGGNREVVENGDTGLLVPVRDPEALANGILACLRKPEWGQAMGQRAREAVLSRFSLQRMVHDYEDLYQEAMDGKAVARKTADRSRMSAPA